METIWQDLRYATRMLAKSPGFTAVAVLTLALGIGTNTAIFSVVDAVLLRRLPVDSPERLVAVHNQLPKVNLPRAEISALQFRDYADRTDVFESVAAITFPNYNLTGADQPLRLRGMRTTVGLFSVLGVRPVAGRVFTAAEDTYGAQHVVLLSQNVSERMYGSDQGSIGKRLRLDGESYEIIGVIPRTLEVIYPDVELWMPMAFTPRELNEERRWSLTFEMLGRLRSGVSLAAARAAMATMAARMNASMDSSIGIFGIEVRPFVEEHVADVRQPLYILLGAVSLVLLIACANIANLMLARVSSMPGVLHAAMATQPPLTPGLDNSVFSIRDYHPGPKDPQPHADTVYATPDYFAAMGIPLLKGRTYLESEMRPQKGLIGEGSVVAIDEALARIFWSHESALGKQLGWSGQGPWATIVGVVGIVRSGDLAEESKGAIYFPYHAPGMTLVVRTASDPRPFVAAVRQQVQGVDPDQPIYDVKTMEERVAASVERSRFSATLLGLFAGLAFALALIGLNGVITYLVAQRTHEIGVRMALGARPAGVLRLVLAQALGMAAAGVVTGLVAAFFVTRLLANQLYGVEPVDSTTFLVVPTLLAAAALAASSIPALRATRVDPLVALRYE